MSKRYNSTKDSKSINQRLTELVNLELKMDRGWPTHEPEMPANYAHQARITY